MEGSVLKKQVSECPESVMIGVLEMSDEQVMKLLNVLREIEYDMNQRVKLGVFESINLIDCACMRSTQTLMVSLLNSNESLSTHLIHSFTACFFYAVQAITPMVLKELMNRRIPLQTPNGQTLLHLFAAYCNTPSVVNFIEYALSLGLDLNAQDSEGNSFIFSDTQETLQST